MLTDSERLSTSRTSPRLSIDGQTFKQLIEAALSWLQHHQVVINALNVYPIPDGDTGTNMVLTMQSAWAEIEGSPEHNVGRIAHQMAHGALMGARGNSGVILSQIWRGFARSLDDKAVCDARDLAAACQEASATAYKGVLKPVEGTILTVIREVAREAAHAANETDGLEDMFAQMVLAAHETVALTPSLLDVLREAGVVDAGGQGLFIILEGMLRCLRGEPLGEDLELAEAVDLAIASLDPGEAGYGYDVQFLLVGQDLDVDTIRHEMTGMGESTLVVGNPSTVKIHIHVGDPGIPISYGSHLGSLRDVVVEDMQAQYRDFIIERDLTAAASPQDPQEIGIVAVAPGEGLARVFQSLGVNAIVLGGQTMNPSTKDLLAAIESLPNERVAILPNNSNIVLAAQQACELSGKTTAVVPSRFVPQGIAALMTINYQADFETNVQEMLGALEEVETGEVTVANRSVTLNGLAVADGQVIGLLNGELTVTDTTVEQVVRNLLKEINTEEREIITLYYGSDVEESEANSLGAALQEEWPEQEIEVVSGEQPHYPYIISVE